MAREYAAVVTDVEAAERLLQMVMQMVPTPMGGIALLVTTLLLMEQFGSFETHQQFIDDLIRMLQSAKVERSDASNSSH